MGWILWVIAACAFGIGEMLSAGAFFLAPFAIAAAVAAGVDAAAGATASYVAFVAVALATLLLVRPVVRSHLKVPPPIRTGAAALIGKEATVVERIAGSDGAGCVKIDGEVWTARALFDDEVLEPGTRVEVVDIKGATALVTG